MIEEDIKKLNEEFKKIRNRGLIKLMRKGSTGSGYTFETLLGKAEDQECKPDYGSIEIKCKYGFSKEHFTLFTCAPKRNENPALNYLFYNYAYEKDENNCGSKIFGLKAFSHYTFNKNGFEFRLYVSDEDKKIFLKSFLNGQFLENICYWDFSVLKEKLITKLSTLALVDCYPYQIGNEQYVKYTKITFYRLKGFEKFLNLVKNDTICVQIYLKSGINDFGEKIVESHGVQFRIRKENLEKLFKKINL